VRLLRGALPPVLLCALASCGGDPVGVGAIIGAYVATTFTLTQGSQAPTDVLAAGGSLNITLGGDGSTTGQLSIPASLNGGSALIASMAGTFSLSGTTVTFDQAADTFVRDIDFTVSGRTLQGAAVFPNAVAISVTLTRQ